MSRERRRLTGALFVSLLIHGLLLSLTFEEPGLGIPGFGAPWRDRRIEVPDLRVVLAPAQPANAEPAAASPAGPLPQALTVQPLAGVTPATPSVAPAPRQAKAIVGRAGAAAEADAAAAETPANEQSRAEGQGDPVPAAIPERAAPALIQSAEETIVVAPSRPMPTLVTGVAPSASSPDAAQPAARTADDAAPERIDNEALERTIELSRRERAEQEARRQDEQLARQRDVEAAERLKRAEEFARQEKAQRQDADRQRTAQQELARRDAAQREAAQQEAARQEVARQEAARQETARQEDARVEIQRIETARQEAARQEAARQEAVREEAARQEAARQEAAVQQAARQEAQRVEMARAETTRLEAARQEAARAEAARVEAARRQADQIEAARQEASRLEQARLQAARRQAEEAARREAASPAATFAMGEQGNRSAQHDRGADGSRAATTGREPSGPAASAPAAPLPGSTGQGLPSGVPDASSRAEAQPAARMPPTQASTSSGARRRTLFGRADPNVDLVTYAEAWRRKIELNMTFDLVREAVKQPHADPLVTVALRSNGTVESVTFNRPSGVAQIDEAIRRIVHSQAPYQPFPPDLAREFDVIEIRRTWMFDMAIRLY
jgi:hypothetical protein